MNKRTKTILAALAIACTLAVAAAAADFEGTLEVAITAKSASNTATAYIKGTSAKIIPKEAIQVDNGVEGYPLLDFAKKKITLIAPKDKYYLDMPLTQFETAINAQTVKIKPSGQTDTLVGHPAEEWVLEDGGKDLRLSLWATRDLTIGFNIMISLQKQYPNEGLLLGRALKSLMAQKAFPLKAVVSDKAGKPLLTWQVNLLTVTPVDDAEFAIPAGYGKMSDVLKKNRKTGGR